MRIFDDYDCSPMQKIGGVCRAYLGKELDQQNGSNHTFVTRALLFTLIIIEFVEFYSVASDSDSVFGLEKDQIEKHNDKPADFVARVS